MGIVVGRHNSGKSDMAENEMSTASATLVEGMQFVGETGSGHAMVLDGAAGLGRNTGARPMELLLVGLAGCTSMDVAYINVDVRRVLRLFPAQRAEPQAMHRSEGDALSAPRFDPGTAPDQPQEQAEGFPG